MGKCIYGSLGSPGAPGKSMVRKCKTWKSWECRKWSSKTYYEEQSWCLLASFFNAESGEGFTHFGFDRKTKVCITGINNLSTRTPFYSSSSLFISNTNTHFLLSTIHLKTKAVVTWKGHL